MFIIPTDTCFGIACSIGNIDSYDKIYTIKKRKYTKPLAILLNSMDDLQKYSKLTNRQMDFLKKYEYPFTILCNSSILDNLNLRNNDIYKKVAFRISHNIIQKKITQEFGPLFLTSINESGEEEMYDIDTIKKNFGGYDLEYFGDKIDKNKSSDIFEFIGDSLELKYLRKNYG